MAVDTLIGADQIATAHQLAGRLFEAKGASSKELNCLIRASKAAGRGPADLLSIYETHLARHPQDRSNKLKKGKLLLQLRQWQAVVDEGLHILETDPANIPAAELAVQALLRLDRPEQSLALRDRVSRAHLDRHPENLLPLIALDLAASASREAVNRAAQHRQGAANSSHVDRISADALIAHGSYGDAFDLLIEPIKHSDDMLVRAKAIQCGAALQTAGRADVRFPDELFRLAISQDRPINAWNSTAILVTSTLGAGGAERQVAITASRSAERLAARGLRTVLMCRDLREEYGNGIMLPMLTGYDVKIVDLYAHDPAVIFRNLCAERGLSNNEIKLISGFPLNLRRAIIQMYDQFMRLQPRVVHLWQDGVIAVGSVAAVMAGVPHICASVRNVVAPETDTRRYRPFLAAVYTSLSKRSNVILTANSDVGARDYEEKFGLPDGSIRTIRNALDVAALVERRGPDGRDIVRREMGYSDDEVVLGGVFRLVPAKRPHRWLDVAAKIGAVLPNARFMIVGDGPMRADLQAYAGSLGIGDRVRLVGRKSPAEPWIAAMDLMLLASELEGLPNVLIEAQALGVPVVTTNAGGSAEALSERVTGTVVMTDSVDDLARECLAFLGSKELQERARHEGPIFIRGRFGVERMVDETLSAYREADEDGQFADARA
jgi:glycosyltransferase involved in cell wall biosynthesis